MSDLNQVVIDLHNSARAVEQAYGVGKLSVDIRRSADRLNEVIKNIKPNRALQRVTNEYTIRNIYIYTN